MIENISNRSALKKYITGVIELTPILNVTLNSSTIDTYDLIGKYIVDIYDDILPNDLSFFNKYFIKPKRLFSKEPPFDSIGILFLTSLDENELENMFGEGIKHSEFGEGFDNRRSYQFISYMIKINGYNFHIGVDHRGTTIECDKSLSNENLLPCLKQIVDLYKEKN